MLLDFKDNLIAAQQNYR